MGLTKKHFNKIAIILKDSILHLQKNLLGNKEGSKYLKEYIKLFFDSILFKTRLGKLMAEIYECPNFICLNFKYSKRGRKIKIVNSSENLSKLISNLRNFISLENVGEKLLEYKELVGCSKNSFFIIKQNKKKYWHKKNAIADISEIIKLIKG